MGRDTSARTAVLMYLACAAVALVSVVAFDLCAAGRAADCRAERRPDLWGECARDDVLAHARRADVVVAHRDSAAAVALLGVAGSAYASAVSGTRLRRI